MVEAVSVRGGGLGEAGGDGEDSTGRVCEGAAVITSKWLILLGCWRKDVARREAYRAGGRGGAGAAVDGNRGRGQGVLVRGEGAGDGEAAA